MKIVQQKLIAVPIADKILKTIVLFDGFVEANKNKKIKVIISMPKVHNIVICK